MSEFLGSDLSKIANEIDKLAINLKPGSEIRFRFISLQEAEDKLVQQRKYLEQLQNACKLKIENFLHAAL